MSSDVEGADDQPVETAATRGLGLGRVLRILLVTVLILAATAAVLLVVPKSYESSASLLVTVQPSIGPTVDGAADFDSVMSSRAELIKSRELLLAVVDAENLRSVPEFAETGFAPVVLLMRLVGQGGDARSVDETVLSNLAARVSVVRQPDSALLSVVARSGDPALAARIANTLARTYVNRRAAQTLTEAADSSGWLQREIEAQRAKVQAADAAVADYRAEHGLFVGATGDELGTVSSQIAEAQQRRNTVEARAKVIRDLIASGQSLEGITDVQRSVVVQSLLQTKANLTAELAQKSTTLLANHPTIKALRAQIRELESQIATEAGKVADAFEAEAKVEADIEQRLRDELARARLLAGDAAKGGATLAGLEREAAAQRDLLDSYLSRSAGAASQAGANTPPDVRMVSEAIPATEPASPNIPLTLGLVAIAAVLVQVGGAILGDLTPAERTVAVVGRSEEDVEIDILDGSAPMASELDLDAEIAAEIEADEATRVDWETQDRLFADDDTVAFDEQPAADDADSAPAEEAIAPTPPAMARPAGADSDELAALAAAVTTHQLRTVLLASVGSGAALVDVVERLLDETLAADLSAVVVDAGSGDVSAAVGLTDLAAGAADYGEVVQQIGENLAEVQWGRRSGLDYGSSRPLTLIEALADIYHVVIVDTGRAGMASSLPLFANARATVVLVADGENPVALAQARREIGALGFTVGRVVTLPSVKADVA